MAAAKAARALAVSGKPARLQGPKAFRTRLYKPELAHCKRWRYVVFCPTCRKSMFPDTRSLTCRECWNPRNSERHMQALAELNEKRRRS